MALRISPSSHLEHMDVGEECFYTIDMNSELKTKTVNTHEMKIYDSSGDLVTSDFDGGHSISAGIITFGIIAYATGTYRIELWVTCNELLPDGVTPYEFVATMHLTVLP